ncbi:MAG: MFS transporter [Spirochaetes bacterium]|nr:MAG: MFS transporter [Spirochaetota bacterium]
MKRLKLDNSRINFIAFLWHALFLALASNFMDINTIIPTMLFKAGGNTVQLGFLTAIMIGGASLMQVFFAGFLAHKEKKKPYLLIGIYLRVSALLGLGFLLSGAGHMTSFFVIASIFTLITIFSFSGSFAGISYTDILGKSINKDSRKKFFILKQTISSTAVFASALLVRYLLRQYSYPKNYSILFIGAGTFLLTATLGFWMIREKPTDLKNTFDNFKSIFKLYVDLIKKDRNVRYYILLINSAGLGLTLVPFYIALAKHNLGLTSKSVGNFLLLQIIGMIVSNLLWHFLLKKGSYKFVVKTYAIIGSVLPILALALSNNFSLYPFIFLLSGFNISAYQVSLPGILLEISREHNRVLYVAISGAGSVSTILFPLIGGFLIRWFGYPIVFGISIAVIFTSFFIVNKINCKYNPEELLE